MEDKTKKIEVCVGSSDFESLNFPKQVDHMFRQISRYNNNGGCYYQITGDFDGKKDSKAYKMEFLCEKSLMWSILGKIKSVFRDVKPNGCEFVSVKIYDCTSHSFSVLE